ncbi:MAG: hypothetical protein IT204_16830 [Fimbriimonadaceae bacterium]|nr:hypothetical protein [Fimbriimonadaceae bacterium]
MLCRRLLTGCWPLLAVWPVAAAITLQPADWQSDRMAGAEVRFEPPAVTLGVAEEQPATAMITSRQAPPADCEATVDYQLLTWPGDEDYGISLQFGLASPPETPLERQRLVRVGRVWRGPLDEHRAAALADGRWRGRAGALTASPRGSLRLTRVNGLVSVACRTTGGWQTLGQYDTARADLRLYLSVGNTADQALGLPAVRVRFENLQVLALPPRRRPQTVDGQTVRPSGPDWVIYATGPGWLRLGSRAEFAAAARLRDEIWGGNSAEPLPKTLLHEGFENRDAAQRFLLAHLTKVRYAFNATATPKEIVRGQLDGHDYALRLDRGNDPEAVLAIGQTYDLAAELALLTTGGLTPRAVFAKSWLVHATGHGTTDGPVKDDRWMLIGSPPTPDPKVAGQALFRISDGWGGTFGYSCDRWEGPYRDNYGLARALRRLGVERVDLGPPAGGYQRQIVAAQVPDDARDHGSEVLGVQTFRDPPELRDWVIYLTADRWLHIGTRTEYLAPVKQRETVWGGQGDELVKKELLYPERRFLAYDQAREFLVKELLDPRVAFHPNADPRETVVCALGGVDRQVQIARDPDSLLAGYGGYSLGAEIAALAAAGKLPRKVFGKQWLVHATGHGTYYGPVKDDLWMMVGSEPKNGGVTIPDGDGGTFGYSVDQVAGPFSDSLTLSGALRQFNLTSVRLVAEDRYVSADEGLVTAPAPTVPRAPRILSLTPSRGEPGQSFYVTVRTEGMKPWWGFRFGDGVTVSDELWLGRDPDQPTADRWLATLTLSDQARLRLP